MTSFLIAACVASNVLHADNEMDRQTDTEAGPADAVASGLDARPASEEAHSMSTSGIIRQHAVNTKARPQKMKRRVAVIDDSDDD